MTASHPATALALLVALFYWSLDARPVEVEDLVANSKESRAAQVIDSIRQARYDSIPKTVNAIPAQTPSPLAWTDIPDLLKLAEDRELMMKPLSPASSFLEMGETARIETGTVALWLIEGIRLNRRYPTLDVLRGESRDDRLDARRAAYRSWWKKAQKLSPEEAAKLNPLEGSTVSW